MQCPQCQFESPQNVKFCVHCGNKLEAVCPKCGSNNSPGFNFCGECGYDLGQSTETAPPGEIKQDTQIPESPPAATIPTEIPAEGERKHVTVLFSDLTGYTAGTGKSR
jgi:Double zinc ribbon